MPLDGAAVGPIVVRYPLVAHLECNFSANQLERGVALVDYGVGCDWEWADAYPRGIQWKPYDLLS